MHLVQFREIVRDAEVAHAIHPIVLKYLLTMEETTKPCWRAVFRGLRM